jgi:hypothetical protein
VVGSAASGGARDLLLFEELVRIQGLLEEALHRRRLHPQGRGDIRSRKTLENLLEMADGRLWR